MRLWSRFNSTLRSLFRNSWSENELNEDVRTHVQMSADERIALEIPLSEARPAAHAESADVDEIKQAVRERRAGAGLELFCQDVRFGLRQLVHNPGFALSAISALALGIGANAAIFSVVNTVLLKPLTYPDADRIVQFLYPNSLLDNITSIPEFHFYQRQASVFQEVAAYDFAGPGFNLTGERPEQVRGIHVTEGFFHLFGAPMQLGRTFTPQEDLPHGGKVVVLSYGLWQRRFAGDRAIVGKSLLLGSEPYTILGVVGKDFVFDPEADIWLPFQFPPVSEDQNHYFLVAGKLKPGFTVAQANAQLMAAAPQYHRDFPHANPRRQFGVEPLRDSIIGGVRNSLLVLLGAVSLVLVIACANVANLLLVRATGRKREFAIRAALGADRTRIVRQLLTESILLSFAGGILGLVLGLVGVRVLLAVSPAGLPHVGEDGSAIGVDWRLLAFTLAISLLTGILFGLFPALGASRTDLNSTLKESSNRSGTGFRQGKTRSLLVVSEVSLALVLLIGAALLMRTMIALHGVAPGFDSHNVLTMEMSLNGDRFQKTAGVAKLSRDGRDRLSAIPGVEASAAAFWLPIEVGDGLPFQIVGRPVNKDCCGSRWMSVSPGYMSLFRIPILRGRDITENDSAAAPGVALINQSLANKYWPHEDPVGQHVLIGKTLGPEFDTETVREIVGIIGDTHNTGLGQVPDPMMIVPLAQVPDPYTAVYNDAQPLIWVVRTHGDLVGVTAAVTEQLRMASGGFPVAHIRAMDEVMGRSTARASFNMLLLAIFAAVALVLAVVGIYGLMACSVEQRTQEMGIRMALGADRSVIRRLVIWQGMRLTLVGLAAGIAAAFGLVRLLASFLFGVRPWDLEVFVSVPLILFSVALLAVWLPARRASNLDPIQALHVE